MLNEIREKLEELGKEVVYGILNGNNRESEYWDYIVFGRSNHTITRLDSTDYFYVAIIQEDYIKEGTAKAVIEKMESIPGMKVEQGEHSYNRVLKGKTNTIIEMLTLTFHKARKGW